MTNWQIIKILIYDVLTSSGLEIVSSLSAFLLEGELINTDRIIVSFMFPSF